jgi:hypothetical protein
MAGKNKQNLRRKPSVKFWLLTWPQNQVQKLAMLKDYFEEEEEEEQQQQPASAEVAVTNNGQQNQPNCSVVNIFSWINQFISRVQNFISLNCRAKYMRYAFFRKSKH